VSQRSGSELATSESRPEAVSACARCHGAEGQLPMSDLVPVLHGQPADYLMSSLQAYAEGKRRSGIMQPLAADLQPEDMRQLADYYAGLTLPEEESKITNAELIERGRKLAVEGAPDIGVPPCVTCHTNPSASYPRLAGQHAAYMARQLRLRRSGYGPTTDMGAIMAPIAQRLSEEQIDGVSAYFTMLPPEPRRADLP
jgi:cytochrome c553